MGYVMGEYKISEGWGKFIDMIHVYTFVCENMYFRQT